MKRTRLTAGLSAGLLAVSLAACSSNPGAPAAGTADDPRQLSFYMDKAGWQESFDDMNTVSRAEGAVLDVVTAPGSDAAAYDSFVKQALQTKEKPDLFTWHTGGQLKALVEQGVVAETSDIWAKAEAAGYVPKGLKDNYTFDGKQYCVPLNVVYWGVYYNKHVFAEHGVEVPTTYQELMSASATLKAAGVTPFFQMNFIFEFAMFQALLAGESPDVYAGLADGTSSFTDPAVLSAGAEWQRLFDEGYFTDPGLQTDPQTLLSTGEVAMEYLGTFMTGQLNSIDQVSGEDYGVFIFPSMNADAEQQLVLESGPLCVSKGAANEAAALEYSAWWMSDTAQQAWADSRGDVSFNPNVTVNDPELQGIVDALGKARIQQRFQEMVPLSVYNRSTEVFGEFVTNGGDLTPGLQSLQDVADAG
ncbi:ABC transporter substrate-binding protein [Glaciibacter psychrotolerans]|uniref:ABC-type glycerol-3-phosphate transport system substrate-binding protein n=1 Tax=Glaciibacter psychrotolerans TaxID=670054 RepID=A0A7Z0J560_9MICO|nr:extracellular solute-binding protein [Leifsonia psychrotolerans]NYJ18563.1 ABC-type glycerol-3-phosphate transport system substrate-binding protein [Leifsonia psychrotolerans]